MNGRAFGAATGVAVVVAALALSGCSSSPSAHSSGTTTQPSTAPSTSASSSTSPAGSAPCTRSAIASAATADSNLGQVNSVSGFGCDAGWAYANVTVGSGSGAYDAVIVLQQKGSTWSVADRGTACSQHLVPASLDARACSTS
jgi:hypothetical protein